MAVIETKYSVGDVAYYAGVTTERRQHPCPDCKGERKWKAISPAGGEYEFTCPRCGPQYHSFNDLSLAYTAHAPAVASRTIGSVRHDSAGKGNEYMCRETGVGSGQVYKESDLYETREEAERAAEIECKLRDKTLEWCAKQYDKSLEICDYQLEGALLKTAKDAESRARGIIWNIGDLFSTIEEAADKDAILEAVDDYKRFTWARDKARVEEAA